MAAAVLAGAAVVEVEVEDSVTGVRMLGTRLLLCHIQRHQ
jgi:hypothetical protein